MISKDFSRPQTREHPFFFSYSYASHSVHQKFLMNKPPKCIPNLSISSHLHCYLPTASFPGGSDGKESAHNVEDPGSIPGSGRSPLEKEMATHSSILAWRIHGQRSRAGYSLESQSQTRLSN